MKQKKSILPFLLIFLIVTGALLLAWEPVRKQYMIYQFEKYSTKFTESPEQARALLKLFVNYGPESVIILEPYYVDLLTGSTLCSATVLYQATLFKYAEESFDTAKRIVFDEDIPLSNRLPMITFFCEYSQTEVGQEVFRTLRRRHGDEEIDRLTELTKKYKMAEWYYEQLNAVFPKSKQGNSEKGDRKPYSPPPPSTVPPVFS